MAKQKQVKSPRQSSQVARKSSGITPQQFVAAWEEAGSVADVITAIGMSKSAVAARAAMYRRKGVKLKSMPQARANLDVAGLNELIKKVASK